MKSITTIFSLTLILGLTFQVSIAQTTAIKNVTIIDVLEGVAKPNMTVIINGEKILAVNQTKITPSTDFRVIDGTGKYLIPGLWDMHMHNVSDTIEAIPWDFYYPDSKEKDMRKLYMPIALAFGVTGVRELSGGLKTLELKQQINSGEILGPHMVVGSPLLDGPNPLFPTHQVIAINGTEKAKDVVTKLHKQGFDFLKTYSFLSAESYRAIHERALELGMEVSGEIPISVSVWEAVELGHRTIEHMTGIELACSDQEKELRKKYIARINNLNTDPTSEDRLDIWNKSEWEPLETLNSNLCQKLHNYLAENNTYIVPTLLIQHMASHFNDPRLENNQNLKNLYPWFADLTPIANQFDPKRRLKKIHDYRLKIISNLNDAGVNILAGSDTNAGYTLHLELELLVKGGLPPIDALRAATIEPARYLKREMEIGSVTPGKIADLVLLNANPLQDISNTQKIETVIFKGNLLDRSKLDRMLNQLENKAKKWED
ncbi:amidohydrolase family protein [Pontixanthobacter gangjinensis]|uniref:Amidohydrolase family protein n=1 Tax=Christiangramia aestuarii TaxID=1028746 RepID=A0A7K1LTS5_9FLAO|nr:amidohydrolase family protein [Christiangramia aestuarii]MUP43900.1 amidohydrolase family protein [Christiangramia aestuarii]